ncbi:hypothetical protein NKR19_g3297 [Coniochaeta hoffmannii]|uniref:Uncharacterized protein n=1 Tax=Coniochaeta hoffmannii TaxID=91930 RepID=A0AA38SEY6_9PEZI|nr:hypothetical protein NKR19_g3297 [Coniochaeta hoffmannii]
MKTSAFVSFAASILLKLINADVALQVNGPGGTFAVTLLDQGDQLISSREHSPLFKTDMSAVVLNAGETINGQSQACGCVAFVSPSCSGNPRVSFGGNVTEFPSNVAGNIGCYVCV